jgi:hypothetical protein
MRSIPNHKLNFAMLYFLLPCFFTISLGAQIRNITVNQNDPSVQFSSNWQVSRFNGVSYAFANTVGAKVDFLLPSTHAEPVISVDNDLTM